MTETLKAQNSINSPKTLSLILDSGHNAQVTLPLKSGTYEHLSDNELFEVATFLRLKGLRSPHTLRLYTGQIEKFLWWMQWQQRKEIDEWLLMDYQQALLTPPASLSQQKPPVSFHPLPPATADQYFQVIRSFCRHLSEKNILAYNPARQVPSLNIRNESVLRTQKNFTDSQWQQVLETLNNLPSNTPGQQNRKARLNFCIRFQYSMALRVHEMANHQHLHINLIESGWQLKVVGKGRRARAILLDEQALAVLTDYRQYLNLSPLPQGEPLPLLPTIKPVVIKSRGIHCGVTIKTKAVSCTNWQKLFSDFIHQDVMHHIHDDEQQREESYTTHWAHLSPHSLRHTRITHLANAGKELLWLQRFAGHENVNTTAQYYHG